MIPVVCSCAQLRERYLKEEDLHDTKATYKAIRKALATLDDPFTRLLEPTQFAALRRGTAGSVTGVGLEVGFDTHEADSHNLVVSACTCPSMPAHAVLCCPVHLHSGSGL